MKVLGANLWIAVALLQHVSTAQKEEEDAADTKPFRDHLRRNGKNDEYKYRGQWFTPGPDSTNGDDTTAGTSDVDFKHDNNWWRSLSSESRQGVKGMSHQKKPGYGKASKMSMPKNGGKGKGGGGQKTSKMKKGKEASTDQRLSVSITEEEVASLFSLWNAALATGDSDVVTARYAADAVLLPTVSDTPRTTPSLIKDYFDTFLLKQPQGEILESHIHVGRGWAKDSGIYEFTMGSTGAKVKGRYSFIYVQERGEWKILHHHSSIMPEGIVVAERIKKADVHDLFKLWNDALATGDSQVVANRYASKAVLLPTVSNVPRNTPELIKEYFDKFLLLLPRGRSWNPMS